MDGLDAKEKIAEFLKKYKYVVFIVLLGLCLMLLPDTRQKEMIAENQPEIPIDSLQSSLEKILTKIDGAGKVSVLLTEYAGEEMVYEMNENINKSEQNSEIKQEIVILSDSNRKETGLVRKVISPVYQGAIVVCQGGDNAVVRLAIVEAVSKVTGLSTNQISVLKMK